MIIHNATITGSLTLDGVEIARTFHRHVVHPGDNVSNEDPKVQSIANVIWTPEVILNYQNSKI